MIYDTSYTDKETTRKINEAVGMAFTLKERWKLGGIGSGRMAIREISEVYEKYLHPDHYVSNANIEIRPKGLLLHFRHKLQVYSWVMPFDSLVITNEPTLHLEVGDKFIHFKSRLDEKFLRKLMLIKESN